MDGIDADTARVDEASMGSSLADRGDTQKNGILDNRHTGHNARIAHKECNDHIGPDRMGHAHENLVAYA
jgi:hypothetical protein